MATKPADPATTIPWATDTNLSSGPQSGQTTKFAPSLAYMQQGCVPGRSAPGRYMNYFFNQIYLWLLYLRDGVFDSVVASATNDVRAFGDFEYCDNAGAATTVEYTKMISLTAGTASSANWFCDRVGNLLFLKVTGPLATDIMRWELPLPKGQEAKQVRVNVSRDPAGTGSQMKLEVFERTITKDANISNDTCTSLGSDTTTGTGDDLLFVNISPVVTGAANKTLVIEVTASGGGTGLDSIIWLDYTFNDPGPRNF
jgi:hypothetical protein